MSDFRKVTDVDLRKIVEVTRDIGGALSAGTGIYLNGNPETVSVLASAIASIASELLASRAEKKGASKKGASKRASAERTMTGAEQRLAARLLTKAADEFGNHGCNDFDLVGDGGMLVKEAKEFRRAYHDYNGDPESFAEDNPNRTDLADFAAMSYLAHLLDEEGRRVS